MGVRKMSEQTHIQMKIISEANTRECTKLYIENMKIQGEIHQYIGKNQMHIYKERDKTEC